MKQRQWVPHRAGITRRQFGIAFASAAVASRPEFAFAQGDPETRLGAEPFPARIEFERRPFPLATRPFALQSVSLLEGPFREAQKSNIAYIKRLDPDRLLHVFRVNAGIASTALPMGGWEAPHCELRGHFVGHYLSALAIGQASTGDSDLRERGQSMVEALADCQRKLNRRGYLSAFPLEYFDRLEQTGKVWAPFYTLHKIMAGLLDMHAHAGSALALRVLVGMAEWVDEWSGSRTADQLQQILSVEFGGMNDVLYELAAVTGEDRFARTGDRFNQRRFLSSLAMNRDELRGLHANTHIPQVIGAARRFELSSDPRFRNVSQFFWDTVVSARTYATGGTSNREHWETLPHQLAAEWRHSPQHQECCCAYNLLKLTRRLFGWRPEARYMDYYERVLFNHRLGTIQPGTGHSLYFLSLAPGAWKAPGLETDTFWCCNGTAIEEFNKLGDTIYFRDAQGLWLNLFIASSLAWRERGIEVRQQTRFPEEQGTTLIIEQTPDDEWSLRIRIPAWTSSACIRVNGKPADVIAAPGSYASITRRWRKGDRVAVNLPMKLQREPLEDAPSLEAFLYGPIVLAGQFEKGVVPPDGDAMKAPDVASAPYPVPDLPVRRAAVERWLTPVEGSPLAWRTRGIGPELHFKPLYASWNRYTVYWRTEDRVSGG